MSPLLLLRGLAAQVMDCAGLDWWVEAVVAKEEDARPWVIPEFVYACEFCKRGEKDFCRVFVTASRGVNVGLLTQQETLNTRMVKRRFQAAI